MQQRISTCLSALLHAMAALDARCYALRGPRIFYSQPSAGPSCKASGNEMRTRLMGKKILLADIEEFFKHLAIPPRSTPNGVQRCRAVNVQHHLITIWYHERARFSIPRVHHKLRRLLRQRAKLCCGLFLVELDSLTPYKCHKTKRLPCIMQGHHENQYSIRKKYSPLYTSPFLVRVLCS